MTTRFVNDRGLYYYGLKSYESRRKLISLYNISDDGFNIFIKKHFGINILSAIASLYNSECNISKVERRIKLGNYTDCFKKMNFDDKTFKGNYYYRVIEKIITTNIINNDLILKMFMNLRKIAINLK